MAIGESTESRDVPSPGHILMGHNPRVQALAERLRELIRKTVPDAIEKAYPGWHGIGYRHPDLGYFCGVFPQEKSVRLLFEYGDLIPDPDCLLKGSGIQTRYVEVRRQRDIRVRPIRRLIGNALQFRQRRDPQSRSVAVAIPCNGRPSDLKKPAT